MFMFCLLIVKGSLGSGKTEGSVEFLADQTTKEEPAPETDTEA